MVAGGLAHCWNRPIADTMTRWAIDPPVTMQWPRFRRLQCYRLQPPWMILYWYVVGILCLYKMLLPDPMWEKLGSELNKHSSKCQVLIGRKFYKNGCLYNGKCCSGHFKECQSCWSGILYNLLVLHFIKTKILDYHFINPIFYNMPCKASKGTFKGVHVSHQRSKYV